MPIYEFVCNECKKTFERFVMNPRAVEEVKCPKCGSKDVEKLLSTFSCCPGSGAGAGLSSSCGTGVSRFG